MEHTVQAYLERRSSGELLQFLEMCMWQDCWGQYAQTVPQVFAILQNRNIPVAETIQSSWQSFIHET